MSAPTALPKTKTVRLWLDTDLIEWFKTHKGDARGYQTAINAALRRVVEAAERGEGE